MYQYRQGQHATSLINERSTTQLYTRMFADMDSGERAAATAAPGSGRQLVARCMRNGMNELLRES
jgi:hypothetical protein